MSAPWVWDEHLAEEDDWADRPVCPRCNLYIAGNEDEHTEECQ